MNSIFDYEDSDNEAKGNNANESFKPPYEEQKQKPMGMFNMDDEDEDDADRFTFKPTGAQQDSIPKF
jgi:hypothetical protein